MSLVARSLRHSYDQTLALAGLDVTVERGQIVGVLGPNGAGKSTAMNIMAGQVKSQAGTVSLNGLCLDPLPTHQRVRHGLGYLPQQASIFRDCTVMENMKMAVESLRVDPSEIDIQLQMRGIAHLVDQKAGSLSGGERRRLELARSLVAKPVVLLLDEPFSGVDPVGVEALQNCFKLLANDGLGILLTDHSVQATLSICDWVVILDSGTVMTEGCPEEVAADSRVRQRYLGEGFRLEKYRHQSHIGD